ncbi:MAG: UDP-glucose/GDP-mannose dehydrogenase family protein [Spirochaetes bacterium]|mgnify:CR=1 FL=1|nr:UDP-glucose/GDP-mannose dehydrogenase family protein [Spirochaetota bacterium]HOE19358.1 UDP-glucose/GDP-mannose dehydrogenase family protein [Spirochaetota bacterium]
MKISVIGTGYVGLVTGTCFAAMGNTVICVDSDNEKIEKLKKGIVPIYEPGLDELVVENFKKGNLQFTTDIKEALDKTTILFIAVGTPMGEDGSADLRYVLDVAKSIGMLMTHSMIVVDKSTVPVGTAEKVKATIHDELKKRGITLKVAVVSNPEFLKEGAAVEDFMRPDRVIIGTDDEEALAVMKELYAPFTHSHERFIAMDIRSAEMTKYTANAMLATKISFMNEIANICERVGADVNMVRIGIGSDHRIGYSFIYPGVGYGGSCFPKDVQALIKTAKDYGYEPKVITAVEEVNNKQKLVLVDKVVQRFGEDLTGKIFALWGLAFKPETDDMREAASITIIKELVKRNGYVKVYDPRATEQAKQCYLHDIKNIEYETSKYDALNDAEALLLVTEWKDFRSPDFDEIKKRLKNPVIFDGRNQYNIKKLKKDGFEIYQIGVGNVR